MQYYNNFECNNTIILIVNVDSKNYMKMTSRITLSNLKYSQNVLIKRSTISSPNWTSNVDRYRVNDSFIPAAKKSKKIGNLFFLFFWSQVVAKNCLLRTKVVLLERNSINKIANFH